MTLEQRANDVYWYAVLGDQERATPAAHPPESSGVPRPYLPPLMPCQPCHGCSPAIRNARDEDILANMYRAAAGHNAIAHDAEAGECFVARPVQVFLDRPALSRTVCTSVGKRRFMTIMMLSIVLGVVITLACKMTDVEGAHDHPPLWYQERQTHAGEVVSLEPLQSRHEDVEHNNGPEIWSNGEISRLTLPRTRLGNSAIKGLPLLIAKDSLKIKRGPEQRREGRNEQVLDENHIVHGRPKRRENGPDSIKSPEAIMLQLPESHFAEVSKNTLLPERRPIGGDVTNNRILRRKITPRVHGNLRTQPMPKAYTKIPKFPLPRESHLLQKTSRQNPRVAENGQELGPNGLQQPNLHGIMEKSSKNTQALHALDFLSDQMRRATDQSTQKGAKTLLQKSIMSKRARHVFARHALARLHDDVSELANQP